MLKVFFESGCMMSSLSLGNIAVEAQRAVRLDSQAYGDRVLCLVDDYIAENNISYGGLKELLRFREIFCAYFYNNNSDHLDCAINVIMGFAFKERGEATAHHLTGNTVL